MLEYASYALVLFALGAYVLLDGYDLGIGILSLFDRSDRRRREYNELIATAWDANESWLILAAVVLWAGMPGVYATVLPGIYLPLVVMLLAIVLRGAAIELQSAAPGYRRGWGLVFGLSSLVAALCQGLVIGAVLSGLPHTGGVFTGDGFDWLTPYSALSALGLTTVYLLAGAAWLQNKTVGTAHRRAGRLGRPLLLAVAAASIVLGLGLPLADPQRFRFDQPLRVTLFGLAMAAAVAFWSIAWYGFGRRPDWRPFTAVAGVEAAGLLALVAATAPVIVPPDLTIHVAASPPGSQQFLLIGVGGCMPVVLAYNIYAWWVFRGKVPQPPSPTPASGSSGTTAAEPAAPVSQARGDRPRAVVVARRVLLTLLAVAVAAVSQDVFGGVAAWIGPMGVAVFSATALAVWIRSDRNAAAAGAFDFPTAEK
ncbi:cytochrome bd-I ubiquinol oxidase subunit 2 apoprotein [Saccharopolyspora shandongensis]|uniref:Cytochrome bd-I ubiquinol oxidase subunit 2 apoprotein n=1 Tax=Saccharopolyspora shandongensis TaxID=418495 RepID=A0A1H3U7P0_9PSEU|nr:cytochrome d ubiquinol oxidase subunit II [Saccharopolyspora shandongensis]SDZ58513.1 cytochrome bd-I ubiquinol oxidase subunit 2 apoprotein [Saccharopolyspora shandongensis]